MNINLSVCTAKANSFFFVCLSALVADTALLISLQAAGWQVCYFGDTSEGQRAAHASPSAAAVAAGGQPALQNLSRMWGMLLLLLHTPQLLRLLVCHKLTSSWVTRGCLQVGFCRSLHCAVSCFKSTCCLSSCGGQNPKA